MNKREQARKERIDFVISHSHVGDLGPTLEYLKALENTANDLYELNVRYAMSFVKPELLSGLGWHAVSCTGTMSEKHIWELQCPRESSVYLSLTSDNRWQYLGENIQFRQCDWSFPMSSGRLQFLEKHLSSAIAVLPPQSLTAEDEMLRQICPRLTTVTGKVIDISKESVLTIWERMVRFWCEHDDNTSVAVVFSMLRHMDDLSSEITVASFLIYCGEAFSVAVWYATGSRIMLEHIPDGCLCTQYAGPANLLYDMECYLAAFHCINICWLYTPQQPWYIEHTYLEYAQAAIAECLKQKKMDDLQTVIQRAEFYIAERKNVFKDEADTISYVKGLLAARAKDYATAVQMFDLAYRRLPAVKADEEADLHKGMRLQLQQCLMAANDCLKKKRGFTRHQSMFKCSLEYFPHIPWYHLIKGSELPSPMEYPGHGEHLEVVLGHPVKPEDIERFASMFNAQTPSRPVSFEILHGNGDLSLEVHSLALPVKSKEVEVLVLVKNEHRSPLDPSPSIREFLAFFPAIASSSTIPLTHSVSMLSYDPRNMECLFTLDLPMGDVEFYMVPTDALDGYSAPECAIALSAVGYYLQPLVETTIPTTDSDGKPTDVYIDNSLRVLTRSDSGRRDDVEFVAQIQSVKKIAFLDTSLWVLTLSFDERVYNLKLPMFINCSDVQNGYVPKIGDVVNGVAWLQGRFDDGFDDDTI